MWLENFAITITLPADKNLNALGIINVCSSCCAFTEMKMELTRGDLTEITGGDSVDGFMICLLDTALSIFMHALEVEL